MQKVTTFLSAMMVLSCFSTSNVLANETVETPSEKLTAKPIERIANNVELEQALKDYNESYEALVLERRSWDEDLKSRLEKVNESQQTYQEASDALTGLKQATEAAQVELDSQKAHLEFLKKVEPLALKKIANLKNLAVRENEFSDATLVNEQSLLEKYEELQKEVNSLEAGISDRQNRIREIEASAEYTGLVQTKNRAVRRRSQKRSELSQEEQALGSATQSKEDTERRLRNSVAREEEANRRAIQIRSVDIPQEENVKRRLLREEDRLLRELDTKKAERKTARENRDQARSDLETKQQEVQTVQNRIDELQQNRRNLVQKKKEAATPEEKQRIQGRIDRVKERIQNQKNRLENKKNQARNAEQEFERKRRRFRRARRAVEEHEGVITTNRNEISTSESRIRNLEELAAQASRDAGTEQSNQIRLENEIDSRSSEIAQHNRNISGLKQQLRSIQSQINQANNDISNFRTQNIVPIENEISNLRGSIAALQKRQDFLTQTRDGIIRSKRNIAESHNRIKDQEAKVAADSSSMTELLAQLDRETALLQEMKAAVNSQIQDYNGFLNEIKDLNQKFRTNEENVLKLIENEKGQS